MGGIRYEPFPDISAWTSVPFDPTTYDQYAALLEQARAEATEEAREHAVRTAIRYAGTDTGAIEGLYTTDRGFTRTVAIEAAHWEAAANERGPNAAQLIRDQIEAYEWLLDLVTESRPVTEHLIRELHAMLCRSQDTYVVHTEVGTQERPLPKGEYKQFPNNPTSLATGQVHHYAPPEEVATEVHRLVESLVGDDYQQAHPVVQASYVHYSLVAIHPFADGNGRTTRALASVPLYRAARVPLLVFRDQREEYLDALGAADTGALGRFLQFVNDRVLDTTDLVRNSLAVNARRDRDTSVAALLAAQQVSGLTRAEVDAVAARVRDEVTKALMVHVEAPDWPQGITGGTANHRAVARKSAPEGYRWPAKDMASSFYVSSPAPAKAITAVTASVAVAQRDGVPVVVVTAERPDVAVLGLPARDLAPEFREVARIKITDWSALIVDAALRDLAEVAAEVRRSQED